MRSAQEIRRRLETLTVAIDDKELQDVAMTFILQAGVLEWVLERETEDADAFEDMVDELSAVAREDAELN